MLLTVGFVLLLFYLVTLNGRRPAPNAWQSSVENMYDLVLNLVNEQIGGPSSKQQAITHCFGST